MNQSCQSYELCQSYESCSGHPCSGCIHPAVIRCPRIGVHGAGCRVKVIGLAVKLNPSGCHIALGIKVVPVSYTHLSRDIVHKAHKRVVRKRLTIFLVLVILAAVVALVLLRYDRYHQFTDYQVIWEKNLISEAQEAAVQGEGSFCGYMDFGDGVLKYTKDGASYLDAQGKVVWVQSYEMKTPMVSINGEYAAIGDQQGNSIYICNKGGPVGKATTLLPILRVTVSAKGMVCLLYTSRCV